MIHRLLVVSLLSLLFGSAWTEDPDPVARALARAGKNRAQLARALEQVPAAQRPGLRHLIAHMPQVDLERLDAAYLLENTRLAYQAMSEVPWGKQVPQQVFLDCVLPYASVNERRDRWREQFHERFGPLIKDCKTPGEAAVRLNQRIFKLLGVRYSKKRLKPDQSPLESIKHGTASCTGLSILLIDACRAVGVPARFVGTPLWSDRSGNHSWVEIWDGTWRFTGAAEPSGNALDRAWFQHRASQARPGDPLHAIYAVSYTRTDKAFPLVWDRAIRWVSAVDVTRRYLRRQARGGKAAGFAGSAAGKRLAAALARYFSKGPAERKQFRFERAWDRALARHTAAVREMAWQAYREGRAREQQQADFKARRVVFGKFVSPYTLREVGERPAKGWAVFIAMHGGGGAAKRINDSQWRIMQRYYRDHPEAGGYLYVAIRAPNDVWNGFYAPYNLGLTDALIRQLQLFRQVDPNKVFLMGYSHGGYGAFYQGAQIADRFAAVHASAAAPHPGHTPAQNLRNTRFTYMVGERDTRYGRARRCLDFDKQIRKLRESVDGVFDVRLEFKRGYGHGGLPDRDKIKSMYPAVRNPVPRHVTWQQTNQAVRRFFWLGVDPPGKGQWVEAVCRDNQVTLKTRKVQALTVYLDERLVDLSKPVTLELDGKRVGRKRLSVSLKVLCETLAGRGDPACAYTAAWRVTPPVEKK